MVSTYSLFTVCPFIGLLRLNRYILEESSASFDVVLFGPPLSPIILDTQAVPATQREEGLREVDKAGLLLCVMGEGGGEVLGEFRAKLEQRFRRTRLDRPESGMVR